MCIFASQIQLWSPFEILPYNLAVFNVDYRIILSNILLHKSDISNSSQYIGCNF